MRGRESPGNQRESSLVYVPWTRRCSYVHKYSVPVAKLCVCSGESGGRYLEYCKSRPSVFQSSKLVVSMHSRGTTRVACLYCETYINPRNVTLYTICIINKLM